MTDVDPSLSGLLESKTWEESRQVFEFKGLTVKLFGNQ